jgi:hypothetical protein
MTQAEATMQVHRTGNRVKCERCPRTIGILHNGQLHVKAGDVVVVTPSCSVSCKCGYMNHISIQSP